MSTAAEARRNPPPEVERGRFTDGVDWFSVCAAPAECAPESFRVYQQQSGGDLVLIVSGINSENLRASWGEAWRSQSPEWHEWMQVKGFTVFYTGKAELPDRYIGRARVCEG
ncbi:hypothetical protein [Glycomyces paridis]|uniref:Uncharacterized protein n=1 Tax=Glycomyces paridis TaxID=2126555 RepID=A0A4S8PA21_9ACTN|nr:hypothetical protein [Glycomyces paridis]THV26415.1 hypothetical protein E9998_17790 [Glycomyces paridis]